MNRFKRPPKVDNNIKGFVVFFCKDCEKLVDTKPVGRKYVYRCAACGTKNVAFGTEEAVRNFYRVKEDGAASEVKEDADEKAKQAEK